MNFRFQILLFLFLCGFLPLFAAVSINLPLVLDRVELFYHTAHLQNLRADFRDLDQHIAGRHEMVRWLAKLPEPGTLLGQDRDSDEREIDMARARYTAWINNILQGQSDIVQIIFYGQGGKERFWLARDAQQGWTPTLRLEGPPPADFVRAGLALQSGEVMVSPIAIDRQGGESDPRRLMTMRLISPVMAVDSHEAVGAVVVHMDIGGIARYYRNTYWVHDSGEFLEYADPDALRGDAFTHFNGLREIFAEGKPALWEGEKVRVMWIPMFRTENSGPLWVGRTVDPLPLAEFRNQLVVRVLTIIFLLMVVILLAARWFANRADHLSHELTDGIRRILEGGESVRFHWRGARELTELGEDLSRLAEEHSHNSRELQARARELEESNRYKSEFLANVSHELRTPLNSILLLSKMLAASDSGLEGERRQQAQVIHEAGQDLRSLIDNILDLSRIEARKSSFTLDWIDLPTLCDELVTLLKPQFDAKGLPLRLEIEEGATRQIYSDGDKVRQVIKNFLSNAVKFTDHGEVLLALRRVAHSESCDCALRIEVRDSGIGIPRAKQGRIFDAFRQADGSTSRRYGGTGLGLAISRQLARLLGGEIELVSEEGRGAVFSLLLPLEFDRERVDSEQIWEEGPPRLPEPQQAPQVRRFAGVNLLLIDGDVASLLAMTPLLEAWGVRVHAAGDAAEALEILEEEERIDLVLLDVMMPELDGCDTIRQLQQRVPDLKIIALTISLNALERRDCLRSGVAGVIRKPVDPDEMLEILQRHL